MGWKRDAFCCAERGSGYGVGTMVNCPSCRQPVSPRHVTEDQSRNGVRVLVHRVPGQGTTVDADCSCFGSDFRAHSRTDCPNRQRLLTKESQS